MLRTGTVGHSHPPPPFVYAVCTPRSSKSENDNAEISFVNVNSEVTAILRAPGQYLALTESFSRHHHLFSTERNNRTYVFSESRAFFRKTNGHSSLHAFHCGSGEFARSSANAWNWGRRENRTREFPPGYAVFSISLRLGDKRLERKDRQATAKRGCAYETSQANEDDKRF